MKNNIYIFSNSVLSRKNNSFSLYTIPDSEPFHNIDIYESEYENVILPAEKIDTNVKPKNIPAETIEAFYVFGEVRFNTQFFKIASIYKIPVHIFNYYGNYIGSFLPVNNDNSGEIQILQYEAYLTYPKRLKIAKVILQAAVRNILYNLKAHLYSGAELEETINNISSLFEQIHFAETISELLGFEGTLRNLYYSAWPKLIKRENDFNKRIKQPPVGIVNSLISFGNSILYGVILSEIYRTRLNPFIGFIHEVGDNKQPLVYDISEIFKPIIVDKVIFRVLNLNMINEKDFQITDDGYYLKEEPCKKFVQEIESRLSSVIHHKRLNRKISYRSLIRMECYNLINFLTGKIKTYEPYRAS
ncbi:MAG: type I-B CRISPR-associated endonuclease Cas1b [Melioribacter sp.]|uniref:type I-B CRISPR-associated endonuclease Cas1b n=1 Tax=Rosettibacter primus TaxID=3111523 RepID=UPI00247BD32A|nr:type I-B CRISPR-associated endonuclease Cas1b [Melioribacter sp.]